MTINWFVPGARQPNQPPPSQGRGQVPQPPPSSQAGRARKKQKVTVREPPTQAGMGVASSSQVAPAWKPKFLLDGKPLPSTACVRMWEKGEGGRIAQTLAEGLLLPEDVHAFEEGSEESVGHRLEWHAIAVIT